MCIIYAYSVDSFFFSLSIPSVYFVQNMHVTPHSSIKE